MAAYEKYGGPCITVDFGTATSFGAISAGGDFLGGVICPGVKTASEALTVNTAKLPRVELYKPKNIINRNTVGCMQAGIMYGYVGQVDYILRKMKAEMKGDVKVIATGGLSLSLIHILGRSPKGVPIGASSGIQRASDYTLITPVCLHHIQPVVIHVSDMVCLSLVFSASIGAEHQVSCLLYTSVPRLSLNPYIRQ